MLSDRSTFKEICKENNQKRLSMGNTRKIYIAFLTLCTTLMFSLSFNNPELINPELFKTEGYLYSVC